MQSSMSACIFTMVGAASGSFDYETAKSIRTNYKSLTCEISGVHKVRRDL